MCKWWKEGGGGRREERKDGFYLLVGATCFPRRIPVVESGWLRCWLLVFLPGCQVWLRSCDFCLPAGSVPSSTFSWSAMPALLQRATVNVCPGSVLRLSLVLLLLDFSLNFSFFTHWPASWQKEGNQSSLSAPSCTWDNETGVVVQSAISVGTNNPNIKMKIEKQ